MFAPLATSIWRLAIIDRTGCPVYRAAKVVLILCLGWSLGGSIALAAEDYTSPDRDEAGNIVPTPKGEMCIAPVEEMRKDHMTMLLHQRDKTVQQGIRGEPASLTNCIDCHVTPDASGRVARSGDESFFCTSCHRAVSVKIDCFECHADRPAEMISLFNTERPSPVSDTSSLATRQLSRPYALQFRLDAASKVLCQ